MKSSPTSHFTAHLRATKLQGTNKISQPLRSSPGVTPSPLSPLSFSLSLPLSIGGAKNESFNEICCRSREANDLIHPRRNVR
jgi:hypothetical protein